MKTSSKENDRFLPGFESVDGPYVTQKRTRNGWFCRLCWRTGSYRGPSHDEQIAMEHAPACVGDLRPMKPAGDTDEKSDIA